VVVTVNERNVASAFRSAPDASGRLIGRIDGLPVGVSIVQVRVGGRVVASVKLTNYPAPGPVFSGLHQRPFICQTEAAGLGAPLDANCTARTSVTYIYRSTTPGDPSARAAVTNLPDGFKPYDVSAARPPDLARTTTTDGRIVDYIIRRERGTLNRAVYDIAFLHEPGEPLPDPWVNAPGWNKRLVYVFVGGCSAGYRQGRPGSGTVLRHSLLSRGYAIASSTLNVFGFNCNDVLAAETMMMVKEHFIEQFGPPVFTIGTGGSGGAIQQHLIGQNYPGLLDGLFTEQSYPDSITLLSGVTDCSLLARAFDVASQPWSDSQKASVAGFATWRTCAESWDRSFTPGLLLPEQCDTVVPKDARYDATANPQGTRCTFFDNQVNVYGRDARTGAARRPLDNVGVQYGLEAFKTGLITAEQFVELNERIGGYDPDGRFVTHRTVADPAALRIAYETGRVLSGFGLADVPIIDRRPYLDLDGNIHDSFRSFATRSRLVAANGHARNHVMFVMPGGKESPMVEPVELMDRWLSAAHRDVSSESWGSKLARHRPADVTDTCFTAGGERILEPITNGGTSRCHEMYPAHRDPRQAAGAPLAGDILKCQLKPIRGNDYGQPLTTDQIARLRKVFPSGVCDYTRAGVGQVPARGAWRRY
jgi:hypothetical protein